MAARWPNKFSGQSGRRKASLSWMVEVPASRPAVPAARRRSSDGVSANTPRTVSSNCRMLSNPAANATSAIGSELSLDQRPRRLGPLGPRERQRTRPDLDHQQPFELAHGVAEGAGKTGDAVAIDLPVGEEPNQELGTGFVRAWHHPGRWTYDHCG